MKQIDLLNSPILPGTNLIEASAGTGKTQTIAGLFLRLLLEVEVGQIPLQVDQILVVTYTEAATEELRERIRGTLVRALHAFSGRCEPNNDPFLTGLCRRHAARRDAMIEKLRLSINCFDLAPIFTIHGFCQRALKDRAFESGSLFDTEVLADQSGLMREIADDFWRRNFYEASPLVLAIAMEQKLSAESFLPLLLSCISHPKLRFIPCSNDEPATIATRLDAAWAQSRQLWAAHHSTLRACFGSSQNWGNNPYNDDEKMAPLLAALDRSVARTDVSVETLAVVRSFAASTLRAGATKARRRNQDPIPTHEFFDSCEAIVRHVDDYTVSLQTTFMQEAREELRVRKEQQKVLSYDDLLTRLHDALTGDGGAELAAELRRRFKAALIDEFQDTDPIQATIIERIFRSTADADGGVPRADSAAADPSREIERQPLFLIGDPKQAIYGFRGADIFSYLQVSDRAKNRFTLGENWRSDSGLVRAVNTFFGEAGQPFVFPKIKFERVTPRGRADETPLLIDGQKQPPLHLWFYPRDSRKEIQKSRAEDRLSHAVAAEISRLLAGPNRLGDRLLRPPDFAVLVMNHRQAQRVQDALGALGIPSVQQTQESVFATADALHLLGVLSAIIRPSLEPAVRAALAGPLWGVSGEELHRLQNDEPAWQRYLERHRRYFEEWSSRGFATMFRHWMVESDLRARLLAVPGGERTLTNTLHLAELLHQAAASEKLGPFALTKWLAARIHSSETATDEYQLRLERDENSVQIVTVHKSKGLQYEIVFAPFCWRSSDPTRRTSIHKPAEILFHDEITGELTRDLGPDFALSHVRRTATERLAENVRLLYVAMTRARHRCYLGWGAFEAADTSAPAWILHQARGGATTADPKARASSWALQLKEISDADLRVDLEARAAASIDPADPSGLPGILVTDVPLMSGEMFRPPDRAAEPLHRREFTRRIEADWRVASFSWMTAGHRSERETRTEEPDHDPDELACSPLPAPESRSDAATGIFAYPRGSKAGTCLHTILESFQLSDPDLARLERIVRQQFAIHSIASVHIPGVIAAVQNTLTAPMELLDQPNAGAKTDAGRASFRLNQIPPRSLQVEMEFCFALRPFDRKRLARAFSQLDLPSWAASWPEQIEQLTFSPTRGFLKGYIDLICEHDGRYYLIDWKSNWLGNRVQDYSPSAIQREMLSRYYVLQYHLYAVALHRHLQLRLPTYQFSRHFGGVRYLFLRGIDPAAPGHGIFATCPSADHIEHLTKSLLAAPASEHQ